MNSMPTCIQKKTHCGCVKLLMRESIRIVESIRPPFNGYSPKRSLKHSIKSNDILIHKRDQGNKTPIEIVKGLKIDLRTSKKTEKLKI